MRTTITLDNDVMNFLEQFQTEAKLSFKDAVNQLLRRGFTATKEKMATQKKPVTLKTFSVGKVLDLSDCPSNLMDSMDNQGVQ